jgi:hypothetical protein
LLGFTNLQNNNQSDKRPPSIYGALGLRVWNESLIRSKSTARWQSALAAA